MLVCLVTWAVCFEELSATVVLPADFKTVVTESGIIVYGRVVSVRSALTGPQRVIESVVTVAVSSRSKGDVGETVSFRVPNGQVGRYRRVLVGAPEFTEGDLVVVFLQGRPPSMPTVFGLSQGLYRVSRDTAGRVMVMPPPMTETPGRIVRGDPPACVAADRDVRARSARGCGGNAVKAAPHRHSSLWRGFFRRTRTRICISRPRSQDRHAC